MKTILFVILNLSIISFVSAEPKTNEDGDKFTICAITINSSNEKNVWESYINKHPNVFNPIVELTNYGEDDWFDKACESGVRCDQLLISGHFGGTFFGEKDKTLSLQELETKSCAQTCEGILKNPYEVFLFGCNTLAGKEEDHRTPAQYLQILLDDGFERTQAEMVVESRYGNAGDSNKARMQRIFGGEKKQLYGFSSVGPSGKNIEGLLKKYFTKIKLGPYLQKLQAKRTFANIDFTNHSLAQSLQSTAFTQCGAEMKMDDNSKIICSLLEPLNEKIYDMEDNQSVLLTQQWIDRKLEAAVDALASPNYLLYIPAVNQMFKQINWPAIKEVQGSKISLLRDNKTLKNQILGLIESTPGIALKFQWMDLAEHLGFITSQNNLSQVSAIVSSLFAKKLAPHDKDLICSLPPEKLNAINLDIKLQEVLSFNKQELSALSCIPDSKKFQDKILHIFLTANSYQTTQKYEAGVFLRQFKVDSSDKIKSILDRFKSGGNKLEKYQVCEILNKSLGDNQLTEEYMYEPFIASMSDSDYSVASCSIQMIKKSKVPISNITKILTNLISTSNSLVLKKNYIDLASNFRIEEPQLQNEISNHLESDNFDLKMSALEYFKTVNPRTPPSQSAIAKILKRDHLRQFSVLQVVSSMKAIPNTFQLELIENSQDQVQAFVKQLIEILEKQISRDPEVTAKLDALRKKYKLSKD